ncbi:MAG: glucose 1-dehydrogenase [Proteobacteria bacterium]|nr:glucose 1-dehydrogenase [Pseudomonadota bacterium]
MAQLEGQVALVTGAASGIGRAAAVLFASEGARVVAADIDAGGVRTTAERVRAAGGEALAVEADVSRSADVQALVGEALSAYGRLDCAYNNAGMSGPAHSVAEMPEEQFERALDVMLKGVFLCMKYELPPMLGRGSGAIVNCASGAGLIGFPGQSGYVAAKHGVIGLTKAAALEYSASGIRVNAICPGTARTGIVEQWVGDNPELEREVTALHPIGRIAEPEEIAQAALWLCTERASFVTGSALSVDGGYVAQ